MSDFFISKTLYWHIAQSTVSAFQNFPKNKKDHVEGECLSAVVRMGFYYVYGEETRVQTVV